MKKAKAAKVKRKARVVRERSNVYVVSVDGRSGGSAYSGFTDVHVRAVDVEDASRAALIYCRKTYSVSDYEFETKHVKLLCRLDV